MTSAANLQEILPGLWVCLVEAHGHQHRSILMLGENFAVVWDSLYHPSAIKALDSLLAGRRYILVYSHGDWDHVWGTAGFRQKPLAVVAHEQCLSRFGGDIPQALAQKQAEDPGYWGAVALVPPNVTFRSRLSLHLGGVTLELHHLPGHTSDSIIGWIPEWGVFLGGDAIEAPLPVVYEAELVLGWLAALKGWAGRSDLAHAIPSHGPARDRACLDSTVAYLSALTGDRVFALPPQLDGFYHETHQKNLEWAAGAAARDG